MGKGSSKHEDSTDSTREYERMKEDEELEKEKERKREEEEKWYRVAVDDKEKLCESTDKRSKSHK